MNERKRLSRSQRKSFLLALLVVITFMTFYSPSFLINVLDCVGYRKNTHARYAFYQILNFASGLLVSGVKGFHGKMTLTDFFYLVFGRVMYENKKLIDCLGYRKITRYAFDQILNFASGLSVSFWFSCRVAGSRGKVTFTDF